MLPIKLQIKNIGPYIDETIDFLGVNGDVVAIIGENGAGKTMLVDSVFAALYRYFPSRDSIYKYVTGRAQISFDFKIDDRRYRSIINIDPKKREMEPWLFVEGRQEALTDGKNSAFDAEIEKLLGPAEVALSSVFSAQNKAGSFVTLPKAKRKELFIEMRGLGKLQVISDKSYEREKISKEAYQRMADKIETFRKSAAAKDLDLDPLYKKLDAAREAVNLAETDIKLNSFEVGLLRSKVQNVREIESRQFPVRKRKQELEKDLVAVCRSIADFEKMTANIDNLRELSKDYDSLAHQLTELRSMYASLSAQQTDYHQRMTRYTQTVRELENKKLTAQGAVLQANNQLSRAGSDSEIISTVPCQGVGECADCQFLVNAIKARDTIADLEAQKDNATAQLLLIEAQIKAVPRPEAQTLTNITSQLDNVAKRISGLETSYGVAERARAELGKAEAMADNTAELKLRAERLRTSIQEVDEELAQLEAALSAARKSEAMLRDAERNMEDGQKALDEARLRMNAVIAEVSKAEAEKELARKAQAELDVITPVLADLDQDRKSWNLLAKAFGKTGIQSLEIDAAGPAISEITNDLLFSCFGPRFSIRFVTQVMKDDKSGYKDDFDIYVTDASTDREGSIDDLSGGERVIICEAVSLAIALFNRSRSNVGWLSLWRDEASSAVDDRRAPQYIGMLRKARELGHFQRLFFIAHQQRVTEAADSKVIVANGHVTFE
jgi:exonuclease SbcC